MLLFALLESDKWLVSISRGEVLRIDSGTMTVINEKRASVTGKKIFPNYEIIERVAETKNFVLYRARHASYKKTVIAKVLKKKHYSSANITRLKRECEILKKLDHEGIVEVYGIENLQDSVAIIFEDFGGAPLPGCLKDKKITLEDFLGIAHRLAGILGNLHQKNIIHKNIRPDNIFINPRGRVKIIDIEGAQFPDDNNLEFNPAESEDALPYVSPEQTGRMNRTVDYRTDLYSLGITLYQLLTGRLPFESSDPLVLIHCHIAKKAIPPAKLNPDVPQVISDIVMKLMSKPAEDRYQSGHGLKIDLEKCLRSLAEKGRVEDFELGKKDVSGKVIISRKVYGRDKEISAVLNAFERVRRAKIEVIILSGPPGIGKTALINEIQRTIGQKNGYFIFGRFEPFQKQVPYSGIIQAFQDLIRQILTSSEDEIERLRENLLKTLGANAQIIVGVIPEVELIIGKQAPVPALGPEETENRLNLVFKKFLTAFTRKEHPLVLFLDDLHQIDSASLRLLQNILSDARLKYLLLVGSYQDNAVDNVRPLKQMLRSVEKTSVVNNLCLSPLDTENIAHFIANTLNCEREKAKALGDIFYQKTKGNPFFLKQFFKSIRDKNLLTYDFTDGWQFNLERVKKLPVADNVVEHMAIKIAELPADTRRVLELASCIGEKFDLETLAFISGRSLEKMFLDLHEALKEGLISISGNNYKFLHDRIQKAAYSLIRKEEKQQIHLKIGQFLLKQTQKDELDAKIFTIVYQLNLGLGSACSQKERSKLAQLNLMAGKKAKAAAAYDSAVQYLAVGMNLIRELGWKQDYHLKFALYIERAECEYLTGNFDVAENLFEALLRNTSTKQEKATVYCLKTYLCTIVAKYDEAIKNGVMGLKLLGIKIPDSPRRLEVMFEVLKVKWRLKGRKAEDLLDLPVVVDPLKKTVSRILADIAVSAFYENRDLHALVALKRVNLSLKHGHSDLSCSAYPSYGLILGSVLGDFKAGHEFGKLGLRLNEKFNNHKLQCKLNMMMGTFLNHWRMPAKTSLDYLERSFQSGSESGDLVFAGYAVVASLATKMAMGQRLDDVDKDSQEYLHFLSDTKIPGQRYFTTLIQRAILNLKGLTRNESSFSDHSFNEDDFLTQLETASFKMPLHLYYVFKMQILYLFERYSDALKMAEKAEKIKDVSLGTMLIPEHYFYYSLILAALYPTATFREKRRFLNTLKNNQKMVKKWAENCPQNFFHKYLLITAEISRITGRDLEASELYEQAVESARENEYTQNEAIGNELAARFYFGQGNTTVGSTYLLVARHDYVRWGATAKVRHLDVKYQELGRKRPLGIASPFISAENRTFMTTAAAPEGLDLNTIIKAFQTISSEIELPNLLKQMMKIVIENAGARKGFLILASQDQKELHIEAKGEIDEDRVNVLQSIPVKLSRELSSAMVEYVARTKENLVLNDAANEGRFITDPYVMTTKPKSILCFPIIYKGKLSGIIYLENDLTIGAFTPERLEVLKLLTSQIAISIENALLYQKAVTDGLTGLYNHNFFKNFLIKSVNQAQRYQEKLSLLMVDIDHFKKCNDKYGHIAGDEILKKVSEILKESLRDSDLCARYGGEEFVVVLPKTSLEGARVLAEKLRKAIEHRELMPDPGNKQSKEKMTVSVGVAEIKNEENAMSLVARADGALYKAKLQGRNRTVTDNSRKMITKV